ncbi:MULTISPECIES: hypothetical protein [unclassified Brucella]|uniref:hypothetical protein n=1 Tax=unclassified Brucella TaxID=2632610 RepID=UPI0012AEA127|nr:MULTISPECIES: hypothetical protein [unclassified Brucella]MRN79446.1 hypothetical protein [Brucella sp. 10RB9210]UWF59819.1 hypothetical protein NYO66_04720 [Brucella sp. 2716]
METKEYAVAVTLKLYVTASSRETAKDVVCETLMSLNDTMAAHFVSEWSDPIVTDVDEGE